MRRSSWKGNFITKFLLRKASKNLNVWCRNSVVPSSLVGVHSFIHNGKDFKRVLITREKVGFKFGDFAPTRKFVSKQKPVKIKKKK
jgi:small subunit ribosomal protein S19